MALKRLTLKRGDSRDINLTFNHTDGTPYNIKNWVVFFTMKTNPELPDSAASLQKIVTTFSDTTAGTSGACTVSLVPGDTANLAPGEYDFDIAVTTAANKNYTVMVGKVDLEYDVTHSTGTAGTGA